MTTRFCNVEVIHDIHKGSFRGLVEKKGQLKSIKEDGVAGKEKNGNISLVSFSVKERTKGSGRWRIIVYRCFIVAIILR